MPSGTAGRGDPSGRIAAGCFARATDLRSARESPKRRWRKLHGDGFAVLPPADRFAMAVDAGTGEIAAHVLTDGSADDAAQVPVLLGQTEGAIASVTADGAYDGEPVYAAAAARQRDPPPDVIIPPRASAVPSPVGGNGQIQRDCHIRLIAERGRMGMAGTHGMAEGDRIRGVRPK